MWNTTECSARQGYASLLTYEAQRLALRRGLHLRQTITALHDRSQAWLGLGSALGAVTAPHASARLGVGAITAYLLCMFVLHNTAPALLNLETFDATTEGRIAVQVLTPSVNPECVFRPVRSGGALILKCMLDCRSHTPSCPR